MSTVCLVQLSPIVRGSYQSLSLSLSLSQTAPLFTQRTGKQTDRHAGTDCQKMKTQHVQEHASEFDDDLQIIRFTERHPRIDRHPPTDTGRPT